MEHVINLNWLGDMSFDTDVDGHVIQIDASPENGGSDSGPRPKKLLMVALAGCTAMDVVAILKKMHVELKGFNVLVHGDVSEQHPMKYLKMHVIYQFQGQNLPLDKIKKAVQLSEEKYCGVRASLENAFPISSEIQIF